MLPRSVLCVSRISRLLRLLPVNIRFKVSLWRHNLVSFALIIRRVECDSFYRQCVDKYNTTLFVMTTNGLLDVFLEVPVSYFFIPLCWVFRSCL